MAPTRTWPQIGALCSALDALEIEQMLWDIECPKCRCDTYGILDESRVLLPFPAGAFQGRTNLSGNLRIRTHESGGGGFILNSGPIAHDGGRYASYTPYMVIQDIVRSGMFSEDQLHEAINEIDGLYLSTHEYEVNAKAFLALRPVACECHTKWGSPTASDYGLEFNSSVDPGIDLERDFVTGKPVRTGFRKRSPEARRRRALAKNARRMAFVTPDTTIVVKEIPSPFEVVLNLKFKYIPHGEDLASHGRGKAFVKAQIRMKRTKRLLRKSVSRHLCVRRLPLRNHAKYWYFLRLKGSFCLSEHHPHGDDYLYLRTGFCRRKRSMDQSKGAQLYR